VYGFYLILGKISLKYLQRGNYPIINTDKDKSPSTNPNEIVNIEQVPE